MVVGLLCSVLCKAVAIGYHNYELLMVLPVPNGCLFVASHLDIT